MKNHYIVTIEECAVSFYRWYFTVRVSENGYVWLLAHDVTITKRGAQRAVKRAIKNHRKYLNRKVVQTEIEL